MADLLSLTPGRSELFESGKQSRQWDGSVSAHGVRVPGVLHSYMYSQLYNSNSKLIVRTTVGKTCPMRRDQWLTKCRLKTECSSRLSTSWLDSSDLNGRRERPATQAWLTRRRTNNATIEVIIEEAGFNNSLAGYMNCPEARSHGTGTQASLEWQSHYLQNGNVTSEPSREEEKADTVVSNGAPPGHG